MAPRHWPRVAAPLVCSPGSPGPPSPPSLPPPGPLSNFLIRSWARPTSKQVLVHLPRLVFPQSPPGRSSISVSARGCPWRPRILAVCLPDGPLDHWVTERLSVALFKDAVSLSHFLFFPSFHHQSIALVSSLVLKVNSLVVCCSYTRFLQPLSFHTTTHNHTQT